MKSAIIKSANPDKLKQMIDEGNGRATSRTIDLDDILTATKSIETTLNVSKKYMEGVIYSVDVNAQDFAHAYKYQADSTHFTLTYKNGTWRVSDIVRAKCRPYGERFVCLSMSGETEEAIVYKKKVF